jgi:hypothetical protein
VLVAEPPPSVGGQIDDHRGRAAGVDDLELTAVDRRVAGGRDERAVVRLGGHLHEASRDGDVRVAGNRHVGGDRTSGRRERDDAYESD